MESAHTSKSKAQSSPSSHRPAGPNATAKDKGAIAGVPLFLQPSLNTSNAAENSLLQRMEETEEEPLQPKFLQRMEEEEEPLQAEFLQRMEAEDELQAKLVVGAPNDTYEQEADQVADQVMRQPADDTTLEPQSLTPSDSPTLQPKTLSNSGTTALPGKLNTAGTGHPLSSPVRQQIEPVLNADLSGVRVHNQLADQKAAKSLQAKAFTHKNHIWLGANQSPSDVKLMAHEAAHVVQQTSGSAPVQKLQLKRDDAIASSVPNLEPAPTSPENETQSSNSPSILSAPPAGSPPPASPNQSDNPSVPSQSTANAEEATLSPVNVADAQSSEAADLAITDQAPASAASDPAFQSVVGRAKKTGQQQKTHAPAAAESQAAQAAAASPASEIASQAQANKVDDMQQAEAPAFDKAAFKQKLRERIAAVAPKTLEQADEFKKQNKVGAVKSQMTSQVQTEKEASQKPLADKTQASPDTSVVTPKAVTALPPAPIGKPPKSIGATKAAPKPKGHSEIEAPLQDSSLQLEMQMAEANLTEPQLQHSNEPTFHAAVEHKHTAQEHAATAGPAYREAEATQLSRARTDASQTAQNDLEGMHDSRADLLNQVVGQQTGATTKDEAARTKIGDDIQKIYEATKSKVETILNGLEEKVNKAFDIGAAIAQTAFENYVDRRMRAYKNWRYSGVKGKALWLKDKILDLPDEVNVFYEEGRDLYLEEMDQVIDRVINVIATELTNAKTEITNGRKEIDTYVAQLPEDLQKVGQDAAQEIQSEFDSLEQSVDDKQDELIDSLAKKYNDQLKAVDAKIEAMKEANKGLVSKAKDAVEGVIETIDKLKNMLLSVLQDAASVIEGIIKDPIGFLGNLISGIKQGFDNFVAKIWEHLQSGLIGWLTGAMGSVGIQIPEDIFSLPGIFDLVTQILGLTWDYVRSKAVKLMGESAVAAAETTFEMFMLIREKGLLGLWEHVKEQFADLKESVMDEIKNMLIVQVIQAGVKWILGLLNPASAFVKACLLIYDIIMFFVNQGSQILELMKAVIDGVKAVASGSVGAVAKAVENAMVRALPVAIGFLAAIAGVSGLAGKVQKIVKKIRQRVDKAIDKVLLKVQKIFNKPRKGSAKEIKNNNKKSKALPVTAKDQEKHRRIGELIKKQLLKKPDKKETFSMLHQEKREDAHNLEDKYQDSLKKGINLDIIFQPIKKDEQDKDIDIIIVIKPNDYTAEFSVPHSIISGSDETEHARFKRLLYSALEEVAKEFYKGPKTTDFETEKRSREPLATVDLSEEAIGRDKNEKMEEKRKEDIKAEQTIRESKTIHEKITVTQGKYHRASRATHVPNNIFSEGSGQFFVETASNYYIFSRADAEPIYFYTLGRTANLKQILLNAKDKVEAWQGLSKAEQQELMQANRRLTQLAHVKQETSFTKQRREESQETVKRLTEKQENIEDPKQRDTKKINAILSIDIQGESSYDVLRFIKEKNLETTDYFNDFANETITIIVPGDLFKKYAYHKFPLTPEEAKRWYKEYPSLIDSSDKAVTFLAAILAEPTRRSVSHITNLLLLDERSNLTDRSHKLEREPSDTDKEMMKRDDYMKTGVYEHLSMTQRGSDPHGDTAKEYKTDPELKLKESSGHLPKNVTDRDLASVKQNPTLRRKLEYFYNTNNSLTDEDIEKGFKTRITEYLKEVIE